jgi:hypothetical protein
MVPYMVNFQWWQFLHGGCAEFLTIQLRKIRRSPNHNQARFPGNLRGFVLGTSGASAILEIRILSRV